MAAVHYSSSNCTLYSLPFTYGIILHSFFFHREYKIFSQADRQGFMLCSFSNLENENILLAGWVLFWADPYFILSCQKWDRLMVSGIYFQYWFCFQSFESNETHLQSCPHWEKEVASVPALSSELPARVSGSAIHPLPAHVVSWQTRPESPVLLM